MAKRRAHHRCDLAPHRMNPGKEQKVRVLLAAWRNAAVQQARDQWRYFYRHGKLKAVKDRPAMSRAGCEELGGTYGQMLHDHVRGQLSSFLSNRQSDVRWILCRANLPDTLRHHALYVNRCGAWFSRDALVMADGTVISEEARVLARQVMRRVLKRHRRPDMSRINMLIDVRRATLSISSQAKSFTHWLSLSLPGRGQKVEIPLVPTERYLAREGKRCGAVQINERDGRLTFGLLTDVTQSLQESRQGYEPRTEVLALDTGLKTLFATDCGDLLGRGWMERLEWYDRRIAALAAYRQKHGLPVRSRRYDRYVQALRGYISSEVGRILNRLIQVHAPAEIIVERLNFRFSHLSRRMNRLLRTFGQRAIREKLQSLEDQFGITSREVNPAYSSQECDLCGYVDKKNRPTQEVFSCQFCNHGIHADVGAARSLLLRRSDEATGNVYLSREAVLQVLVSRHLERFPGPSGRPADPRRANPYFIRFAPKVMSTPHGGFNT